MAPDIPKIDPDRHPNLGDAAWNFGDEVLRWFFHGHSLSDSKDLLIPFFGKFKFVEFRRGEVADNPVFRELRNAICTRCRLYGQMEKFRFADDPEVNDTGHRMIIGSLGTWRGRLFRTSDFDCSRPIRSFKAL